MFPNLHAASSHVSGQPAPAELSVEHGGQGHVLGPGYLQAGPARTARKVFCLGAGCGDMHWVLFACANRHACSDMHMLGGVGRMPTPCMPGVRRQLSLLAASSRGQKCTQYVICAFHTLCIGLMCGGSPRHPKESSSCALIAVGCQNPLESVPLHRPFLGQHQALQQQVLKPFPPHDLPPLLFQHIFQRSVLPTLPLDCFPAPSHLLHPPSSFYGAGEEL